MRISGALTGYRLNRAAFAITIYAMAAAIPGGMILSAPLPILLDRFISDDAFYFYKTALTFAQTGFSSFDGIHFTNGYQPLWFVVGVPFFWIAPSGGEFPIRLLLFVQFGLSILATALLIDSLTKLFGILPASIAGLLWLVIFHRAMLSGLETALHMCLYLLQFRLLSQFADRTVQAPGPLRIASLGLVSGLAFLARVDTVFLIASVFVFLTLENRTSQPSFVRQRLSRLFPYAVPVIVISGGYLLVNLVATGHLMPVSGAAKQYHSEVARRSAVEQTGNAGEVYLQNLIWPLRNPGYRFVAVGIIGPWIVLLLPSLSKRWSGLSPARHVWPFYLAAAASFLYYSLSFYGGLTSTLRYYSPHTILACLAVAGASRALDASLPFRRVPGLSAVLLIGFVLGWISWPAIVAAVAVALGLTLITRRVLPNSTRVILISFGMTLVAMTMSFYLQGVSHRTWLVVTLGGLCLSAALFGDRLTTAKTVYIGGIALFATLIIHTTNLRADLLAPPGRWNYNLYLGALWARENLPVDATVWSGSAGILGYFSERTVVNTDGMANDYNFLVTVLQKRQLADYQAQWDYAIDAFPDENLTHEFPEGCFVPLPPELTSSTFSDGTRTRQLRVFQMKPTGIVDCSALE